MQCCNIRGWMLNKHFAHWHFPIKRIFWRRSRTISVPFRRLGYLRIIFFGSLTVARQHLRAHTKLTNKLFPKSFDRHHRKMHTTDRDKRSTGTKIDPSSNRNIQIRSLNRKAKLVIVEKRRKKILDWEILNLNITIAHVSVCSSRVSASIGLRFLSCCQSTFLRRREDILWRYLRAILQRRWDSSLRNWRVTGVQRLRKRGSANQLNDSRGYGFSIYLRA